MVALQAVGGIRTFMRYVYSAPVFSGYRITLLAPNAGVREYFEEVVPESRFRVQLVPSSPVGLYRSVREHLINQRFDLMHSHGLKAGVISELARASSSVPHVVSAHDVFLPEKFSGFVGFARRAGISLVLRQCSAIHAVGEDCASNLQEHLLWLKGGRMYAVRNGIDVDQFRLAETASLREEYQLSADTFLVGFFGRFMNQKGFRVLVDSVDRIVAESKNGRPIRVVTFGSGGFIREDYEYLRSRGLADFFIQRPATNNPGMYMKAVDVIAMPSRWEACPLQPMESLVAGVPIITTDCIGLREVVRGTPAKQVAVDNAGALAAALLEEMENSTRHECEKYMDTAAKQFSVSNTAVSLKQLYEELLSEGEGGGRD